MRKISLTLIGVLAVSAFVVALGASQGQNQDKITKTLTFNMPACPIQARTVPPTVKDITLPPRNLLGIVAKLSGTVQITDQTSSTVILTQNTVMADLVHLTFSRTVKTLQHATGNLAFDRGCSATDPYGSNNCTWNWGESFRAAYFGALQEDIEDGKLIVDMKIDDTVPLQFSCRVCGTDCTFAIPDQVDDGKWHAVWPQLIRVIRFALNITGHPK